MNTLPGLPLGTDTPCGGALLCDHCGDRVSGHPVCSDEGGEEKVFCCSGCKTVYALLRENDLCEYYTLAPRPGLSPGRAPRFEFLDDEAIQQKLLDFKSDTVCSVTLSLPQMHCSSCIWLIEHLYRLDSGIIHSRVDFLRRSVVIQYVPSQTSLRRVVELLSSLGYTPELEADKDHAPRSAERTEERRLYYRIGIAGFCFGNIMLLSFPEYLSTGDVERSLRTLFSWASIALAVPVTAYCASGYFLSAYKGLRRRALTLDVPIALGIAVVFLRSVFDIATQAGPGFLDSLSGLVFFLLLGKLFQNKTYDRLNFERNYRSYFPIAVTILRNGCETTVPLEHLGVGDKVLVRSGEIIPADAWVLKGEASIDYSFVTGESALQPRSIGDLVYAGGRQSGGAIEVQISKPVSQSHLTRLWNAGEYGEKSASRSSEIADAVGKYFTAGVLAVAALAGIWQMAAGDPARALDACTGVLIIACPCALALSIPFTMGTAMRIFGRNRCYVKNPAVVESLASADAFVFDKTGTLTSSDLADAHFEGGELSAYETALIASLVFHSAHPLSRAAASVLGKQTLLPVEDFREEAGRGIEGRVDG
ncbi:MAG: heavy metal translocating P-type ATPase, partial [Acidobacteriota bacterium]